MTERESEREREREEGRDETTPTKVKNNVHGTRLDKARRRGQKCHWRKSARYERSTAPSEAPYTGDTPLDTHTPPAL